MEHPQEVPSSLHTVLYIIESILTHEYFIAVYGVILFYTGYLLISRSVFKPSKQYSEWSFKKWKSDNKVGFVAMLVFAPLVIIMDDEMLDVYNWYFKGEDVLPAEKLGDIVYLMAGPFAIIVTKLISWISSFEIKVKPS